MVLDFESWPFLIVWKVCMPFHKIQFAFIMLIFGQKSNGFCIHTLKTWQPILQKTAARSRTFVVNDGGHNVRGLWLGTDNYRVNTKSWSSAFFESKRWKIKRMIFWEVCKRWTIFFENEADMVKTGCSDIFCSPSD